jgi:sulfoxide reductase heme-binding subunit YedZ
MLVITLTITPLKILFGNSKISRYKKVFGIYSFLYTLLHLSFYLAEHNFFEIFSQINLVMALVATVIIVPLGITSNKFSMRILKRNWKKLQRYAYVAAVAAVLHLALLGKGSWLLYSVILAAGFIIRIPAVKDFFFRKGRNGCSVEAAS